MKDVGRSHQSSAFCTGFSRSDVALFPPRACWGYGNRHLWPISNEMDCFLAVLRVCAATSLTARTPLIHFLSRLTYIYTHSDRKLTPNCGTMTRVAPAGANRPAQPPDCPCQHHQSGELR